jgi:hypothetical protein
MSLASVRLSLLCQRLVTYHGGLLYSDVLVGLQPRKSTEQKANAIELDGKRQSEAMKR